MNPEIKQKWVDALRSGQYEQGKMQLRTARNEYCCLGVLCDLAVKDGVLREPFKTNIGTYIYGNSDEPSTGSVLPKSVREWAGLPSIGDPETPTDVWTRGPDSFDFDNNVNLSSLNDAGATFEEIAQKIEENL